MKLLKKVLGGLGMGVCSLAMAAAINAAGAQAAELSTDNISIDYAAQTMEVAPVVTETPVMGGSEKNVVDKEILVAYPTVSTNKKGVTTVKVPAQWDTYEMTDAESKAVIDLSKLNVKKDSYIMVKGSSEQSDTPILIHFAPSLSGVKVKYDPTNDKVAFTVKIEKKDTDVTESEKFQYRSAFGQWADYTAGKTALSMYAQQGITVYFRQTASESETALKPADKLGKVEGQEDSGYTTYDAGHFAGADAKVKITKLANGPKVTVDYNKHTFTIPKLTEYRFNYASEWTTVPMDGTKVAPIPLNLTEAGTFEARVAAVKEGNKQKAASKFTKVDFAAVETITATGASEEAVLTDVYVGESKEKADISFGYVENAKGTQITHLQVANGTTDKTVQVVVADSYTTETASLATAKVIGTVKPGKAGDSGVTATKAKIAIKSVKGKFVYVRYAGDSKAKSWATPYVCVGKAVNDVNITPVTGSALAVR